MTDIPESVREQLRKWGAAGGRKRAENLTPEQRLKSSRTASRAAARVHRARKKARQ